MRDAYDCWRERYPAMFFDEDHSAVENIEEDGGPCGCVCHDGDEHADV